MSKDHTHQNYRPRSPDLSAFQPPPPPPPRLHRLPSLPHQPDAHFPQGYSFSPRGSYDASPYFSPQTAQPPSYFGNQPQHPPEVQSPQQYRAVLPPSNQFQQSYNNPNINSPQRLPQQLPPGPQAVYGGPPPQFQSTNFYDENDMARLRNRKQVNYNDDHHQDIDYEAPPPIPYPAQQPVAPAPMPQMQAMQPPVPLSHAQLTSEVDVKTKFPVARIKRIMQADEDVGKVAQATPTAVSKALELFMIALVSKGAAEAKSQSSKRVTATHLKTALLSDSQFDFLNEICEACPDEGSKKARAKSEAKSEDSDEEMGPRGKTKATAKRKKGDESD